jgi:hypothetical protein
MVNMPLTIITDRETFIRTEPLKTTVVDEANSKHFNIPLDRIGDPCLVIEISEAIPRLRVGLSLYDPFTPLGFPFDPKELIDDWDDGDLDGFDHLLWGRACWDWVFSELTFNIDPFEHINHYFFRQDGDTYTLSIHKPHGLSEEEGAAWHADIPYGPFAAFARALNATFWPPAPRPGLGSYGALRSPASPPHSSTSPVFTYPESPFPLASVPITHNKSGEPWDPNRLSNHAAHFGVSTPALGDIATHLRVALPAQPSPLPVIRSRTSPRSNRMTASAMNSPHDSPKQ